MTGLRRSVALQMPLGARTNNPVATNGSGQGHAPVHENRPRKYTLSWTTITRQVAVTSICALRTTVASPSGSAKES